MLSICGIKITSSIATCDLCQHGDCLYQPLGIAAKEGHIEIVRMLIAAGIEINFKDSQVNFAVTVVFIANECLLLGFRHSLSNPILLYIVW